MDQIVSPDPSKRPFVAGTYNGHPVAVSAAIETVKYLISNEATLYPAVEALGAKMQLGLETILGARGVTATVVRQGSAFSIYFMKRPPLDFHDIIENHDLEKDVALRRALILHGVYVVPVATKQWSISCAHTEADIDFTLAQFERALAECSA